MSDNIIKPAAPAAPKTITSAAIPQPGSVPSVTASAKAPELNGAIVARPLVSPDFIGLKPKNPQHQFYWGNRLAGGGLRLEELMSKGFALAKPEDVQNMKGVLEKEGRVCYGDLVLLKIDKNTYLGALLHNHNKATGRVSREQSAERGSKMIREEVGKVGGSTNIGTKISSFVPSQADVDALTK